MILNPTLIISYTHYICFLSSDLLNMHSQANNWLLYTHYASTAPVTLLSLAVKLNATSGFKSEDLGYLIN